MEEDLNYLQSKVTDIVVVVANTVRLDSREWNWARERRKKQLLSKVDVDGLNTVIIIIIL